MLPQRAWRRTNTDAEYEPECQLAASGGVFVNRASSGGDSKASARTSFAPLPVVVDADHSPQFYAELWGMSASTVVRWFQDKEGVLKLSKPAKNGNALASNCGFRSPWRCRSIASGHGQR